MIFWNCCLRAAFSCPYFISPTRRGPVCSRLPAAKAFCKGIVSTARPRREEINAIISAGNPSGSFHSPPPFAQGRLSPTGDYQPGPKILLLLFSQKSSAAPVCGGRKKRKGAPGVVPEASFPDQLGRGFMLLSVRGTGKFTRKAKAGPSAPAPFWRIWGCGWCS